MVELGPLEMRILGFLDGAEPQSVADLRARLGNELAYTTVMTVLSRLHDKGLVVRVKEVRRAAVGCCRWWLVAGGCVC